MRKIFILLMCSTALFINVKASLADLPSSADDELRKMQEHDEAERAKDLADTKDYRDQKFVDVNLFQKYFDTLDKQYDKDWALAATVHYCALQPAQIALKNGANIKTEVEFVRNFPETHAVGQWIYLNGENWHNQVEFSILFKNKNYLPRHHPITDPTCFCSLHAESQGKTSIELMALACGDEFSQALLKNIDINALLIEAVYLEQIEAIDTLLAKGADINFVDKNNRTSLYYALKSDYHVNFQNKSLNLAQYLLEKGAKLPDDNKVLKYYLFNAAKHGQYDVAKLILEKGNIDITQKDKNGRNILFYAIDGGNLDLYKLFIEYGADENISDNSGTTLWDYIQKYSRSSNDVRKIYQYLRDKEQGTTKDKKPLSWFEQISP